MAAPACVTSRREAELVLVSGQGPAEWLIRLLDGRGDRTGKKSVCCHEVTQTKDFLMQGKKKSCLTLRLQQKWMWLDFI